MTVVSVYQSLDQTAVVLLQSTASREGCVRDIICVGLSAVLKRKITNRMRVRGEGTHALKYSLSAMIVPTLSTVTRTYILL